MPMVGNIHIKNKCQVIDLNDQGSTFNSNICWFLTGKGLKFSVSIDYSHFNISSVTKNIKEHIGISLLWTLENLVIYLIEVKPFIQVTMSSYNFDI